MTNELAIRILTGDVLGTSEQTHEAIKMAVKALLLPSAPRWTPVSEGLPKPNEENELGFLKAYLVQDERWMDVARWDGEYWIAWGYGMVLNNVTAWMPLPERYERSEE